MELLVLGVSHKTAPVAVREKLAFSQEELRQDLEQLVALQGVDEALLVSTCNRVEVYTAASQPSVAGPLIRRFLEIRHGVDAKLLKKHLYERSGEAAVKHLFRVASSLDSMVVGEPQILGQVKEAFARAVEHGSAGRSLKRCFNRAFGVGKRARRETGIAREAVSVSSVAVDLARKIFGDLGERTVLLVGAGKMSELAARKLKTAGATTVLVANRSPERARELAEKFHGEARRLEDLADCLTDSDIVFISTAARGHLLSPDLVGEAMKARRYRPLFIIDTAVPRNVDPKVNRVSNVYLYDIDDLQRAVESNQAERRREAVRAEEIVLDEVRAFADWQKTFDVVPTIVSLREKLHAIQAEETNRALRRLGDLDDRDQEVVEAIGRSIVNKILHSPVVALKRRGAGQEGGDLVEATRALFDLELESSNEGSEQNEATPMLDASSAPVGQGGGGEGS